MKKRTVDMGGKDTDPMSALKALVESHGSQMVVARRLGIKQQSVSDLLNGRRRFSDAMLDKLGLRRAVVQK